MNGKGLEDCWVKTDKNESDHLTSSTALT